MSHSSLPVALLASHPPCGSFWAAPKAPHWGHASLRDSSLRSPAGKRLLLPILPAGLAMSRAMELDSFHQLLECARARLFRRQNGRAFFPPLPIAALLPRSRRGAYASLASWDASMWLEDFAAWMNRLIFFSPQLAVGKLNPCRLRCFGAAWKILQRKRLA